jgi:putative transposase
MSSYRQHLYHVVIRTDHNLPTLNQDHAGELYSYLTGILRNKKCHLYRINGVETHIHVLTDMHPSLAPADIVRDMKASSSIWIKKSKLFPLFEGWSEGYGSFTCSYRDLDRLIEYVKNQQDHHRKITFEEEYRIILSEAGIIPDEKYFP